MLTWMSFSFNRPWTTHSSSLIDNEPQVVASRRAPFIFQRPVHTRKHPSSQTTRRGPTAEESTQTQQPRPFSVTTPAQRSSVCFAWSAEQEHREGWLAGPGGGETVWSRWAGVSAEDWRLCAPVAGGLSAGPRSPREQKSGVWAVNTDKGDLHPGQSWGEATWAHRGVLSRCTLLTAKYPFLPLLTGFGLIGF